MEVTYERIYLIVFARRLDHVCFPTPPFFERSVNLVFLHNTFSSDTTLARPHPSHVHARLPPCHCPMVHRHGPNIPHTDAHEVIVTGTFDQASFPIASFLFFIPLMPRIYTGYFTSSSILSYSPRHHISVYTRPVSSPHLQGRLL